MNYGHFKFTLYRPIFFISVPTYWCIIFNNMSIKYFFVPASIGELIMVFLCPFRGVDFASCESEKKKN